MSYLTARTAKSPNTKGISMTLGVNIILVAGFLAMPGIEIPEKPFTVLGTWDVKADPPKISEPVPEPKKPAIEIQSKTIVPTPQREAVELPIRPIIKPIEFAESSGGGGGASAFPVTPLKTIDPIIESVITGAKLNQRFSRQFQPSYPAAMVRMEQEGIVAVRVLVGTDGRAKKVELISTPHDDLWRTTQRHALKKWRFKPATKAGQP
jgi:protein TonB